MRVRSSRGGLGENIQKAASVSEFTSSLKPCPWPTGLLRPECKIMQPAIHTHSIQGLSARLEAPPRSKGEPVDRGEHPDLMSSHLQGLSHLRTSHFISAMIVRRIQIADHENLHSLRQKQSL